MSRPGHVRNAVHDVIRSGIRHNWSIDDLVAILERDGPVADFSSVFRAVTQLERIGAVQRVNLGDGKGHYELPSNHHEHILCERCGVVAGVEDCRLQDVQRAVEEMTGFRVTGHSVVFRGLCGLCAHADNVRP